MDFTHLKTNCLDLLAEGLFLKLFWMFDLSTLLPCHLLFSSPRAIRSVLLKFQFIFSTAIDGKIKAWLYDNLGSRVDYDAPGQWCTTMLYSADGSRYENFKIWTSTNWVFSKKKMVITPFSVIISQFWQTYEFFITVEMSCQNLCKCHHFVLPFWLIIIIILSSFQIVLLRNK